MKRFALMLYFLSFALPAAADSPSDAGLAEIRDLGQLNGQALACSHNQAASLIKAAIIQYAPKSRRYGAAFEDTTSNAFLAQVKKDPAACPAEALLVSQAEAAVARLQTAVPAVAPQ